MNMLRPELLAPVKPVMATRSLQRVVIDGAELEYEEHGSGESTAATLAHAAD